MDSKLKLGRKPDKKDMQSLECREREREEEEGGALDVSNDTKYVGIASPGQP